MTSHALESAWLKHVPRDIKQKLYDLCKFERFERDTVIYHEGQGLTDLWAVSSGCVKVMVTFNEMETVLGHLHLPGAWFGESELVLDLPGLVEMRACSEVDLIRLPCQAFRHLANKHPELWEALARLSSMNQLLAMAAANDLVLTGGHRRVAATLLRLSGHRHVLQGSKTIRRLPVTQAEIAGLSNLAPSKTSQHLKTMVKQSLIELTYRQIALRDIEGLRQFIVQE